MLQGRLYPGFSSVYFSNYRWVCSFCRISCKSTRTMVTNWLHHKTGNTLEIKCPEISFFFFFWLHWLFDAPGVSLVVVREGYSSCSAWASYCSGFSCCRVQVLKWEAFSSCGAQAFVVLQHVESTWIRDRTRVPCTYRWIPIHCKSPRSFLLVSFLHLSYWSLL